MALARLSSMELELESVGHGDFRNLRPFAEAALYCREDIGAPVFFFLDSSQR